MIVARTGQLGYNWVMETSSNWFIWALLSAVFAALTAIFAKLGLQNVDSDFATLIRTVVILGVLSAFIGYTGKWTNPFQLPARTWQFLVLSGLATGASWLCYFRALKVGDEVLISGTVFTGRDAVHKYLHEGGALPDGALLLDQYGPRGLAFVVDNGRRVAEGSSVVDMTVNPPEVVRQGAGDVSLFSEEREVAGAF